MLSAFGLIAFFVSGQLMRLSIQKNLCLMFCLLLLACPSGIKADNQLPDAALVVRLAEENAWLRLGHYTPRLVGWRSQIDTPDFFLHTEGRQDPLAELTATLDALQQALQSVHPLPETEDVRCRYPARIAWLQQRLNVAWPGAQCTAFQDWLAQVNAGSVSLVFPAAYMNSAASMFGHSLLRLESRDPARQPDLVAFAVNFAASVPATDGGLAYGFKGMFGMYPGYFSLMPYYDKVNEYNHLENRDMWEYPLSVSEQGLYRMMAHLWELDQVRFDYWFFDENCSYQLLALLSVTDDHLNLTEGFDLKALPVDTVRALAQAGLLRDEGHYRPAFATRLQHLASDIDPQALPWVEPLVFDLIPPDQQVLPADVNAAAVYELAFQWLNFRYRHQGLAREVAAPQLHRLLLARAAIQQSSQLTEPPVPEVAPHLGHATAQWSLASGWHEDEGFLQLAGRPAYHGRYDRLDGYLPNAEIRLLELQLRWYQEKRQLQPWHLTLLEVGNYLASSPVFSMAAWRVQADIGRQDARLSASDDWRASLAAGYGRAWGSSETLMSYALLHTRLEAGPKAWHWTTTDVVNDEWGLAAGLNLGLVWAPLSVLRTGVDLYLMEFVGGQQGSALHGEATLQWNYALNQSLRLQWQGADRGTLNQQVHLAWLRFF